MTGEIHAFDVEVEARERGGGASRGDSVKEGGHLRDGGDDRVCHNFLYNDGDMRTFFFWLVYEMVCRGVCMIEKLEGRSGEV